MRITTQLVIFGTAVLFFHYITGTIFLLLFPSSVSSKTPLTIATWNAEVRPCPASHFPLPAVICRGRGAAPLTFCPSVSSIPAPCSVQSTRTKCPDSQGTHHKNLNALPDKLSIKYTKSESKNVCWLLKAVLITWGLCHQFLVFSTWVWKHRVNMLTANHSTAFNTAAPPERARVLFSLC